MSNREGSGIESFLKEVADRVAGELERIVPPNWDVPQRLKESMMYSLMAGGKRLRPALALAAAEAAGGDPEDALPVACALELIHTYSLIHDDLPAMDDDDFRRGRPTNHRVFGEAMAILAGDALLTHAFHLLAALPERRPGVSAETALRIVKEVSMYAGAPGMVGGQAADILGEQGITTLDELEYIHQHKTSDLIAASLRAGALAAGASERQIEALTVYGRSIGMAFQIRDDILDVIGDAEKLGKSTNSDAEQNKATYPQLIGLAESGRKVDELTNEGKRAISTGILPNPERLLALADYLLAREC